MKFKKKPTIVKADVLPQWRIPESAVSPFAIGWAVLVLFFFLQSHPVSIDYLLSSLDALVGGSLWHPYAAKAATAIPIASLFLWVAGEGGRQVLRALHVHDDATPLERWVLSVPLGLAAIALMALGLGALHLWMAPVFAGVTGIAFVSLIAARVRETRPPLKVFEGAAPWRPVWILFLCVMVALFLIGALLPEIFFDSLFYHLGFPNLYRLRHALTGYPQLYSNLIETVQMAWGFAVTLGSILVPKLLHASCALLLGATVLAFGKRYLSPGAGLLGAAFLLSTPLLGYNGTTAGIDVAWTYFQAAGTFALVRFLDLAAQPEREVLARGWLRLAGLLIGISAACKYPAMPYVPMAGALIAWRRRAHDRAAWSVIGRELVTFLIPASLLVLPYLVRNVVFHGNPVFPFLGTKIGHPQILPMDWSHFMSDAPSRSVRDELSHGSSALHFLLHPWFMTMEGAGLSDLVGPLFLMALPALVLQKQQGVSGWTAARYALAIWLLWLVTTSTARYGLPALALAAPLFAHALLSVRKGRLVLLAIFALGIFVNIASTYTVLYSLGGWRVLLGQMTEDAYLGETEASYPTPPYEGLIWMNKNLPATAKILMVGDSRTFYTEREIIPCSVYDPQPIMEYAKASPDGAAMRAALRRDGVTHIYVNLAEARRTDNYKLYTKDPTVWKTFDEFWKTSLKLVWKSEHFEQGNPKALYVLELLSDDEANTSHPGPSDLMGFWRPAGQPAIETRKNNQ